MAKVAMNMVQWVIGNSPVQVAHVAHVLLAAHGVDDGTRTEEQQRLEEGVGEDVEHASGERAHAQSEKHVAQLRDRGVGQHALDVVLHQSDGGGEDARSCAPIIATVFIDVGASTNSAFDRATIYTPAVTMVAAWIRAETGVGPSMASGSQT